MTSEDFVGRWLLSWYIYAVVAAFAYTGQMLGMQRLQKAYPISVYMAFVWTGAGLLIGLLFARSFQHLRPTDLLLLVGAAFASWLGMYSFNAAMRYQPNLGYIDALFSIRLLLIYGLSILLFGASVDIVRLMGVLGIALGAVLVVGFRGKGNTNTSKMWIPWILLGSVMIAALFVCVKVLNDTGLDARFSTSLLMVIAGLMYAGTAARSGLSLRPGRDRSMLLLTILFATVGNAALFTSLVLAPNLAYPPAIAGVRVVLLYVMSLALGAGKFEPLKGLGVVITVACAALLA